MKWKDMSKKDKVLSVLEGILSLFLIGFAVVDLANLWEQAYSCWQISFAAICFVECVRSWNTKRKVAILELVCGLTLLAFSIFNLVA